MARNNNKINYPTNVVNPITYATYMKLIESQPDGKVDVSYASNTLFPSIKYGKDEEGKKDTEATAKKDTHTIGVLLGKCSIASTLYYKRPFITTFSFF